ncbi:hypothetical protein B566_EDAN001965 [Ephemera danica]|nr:hypothetical protein B566_EDAN001965 [Ephemera danica]
MYLYGTQFATSLIAFCLMGFTVGTVFVPVFRDLKLESCYQYLELRFDLRVLFIPIVIYVPALALSQVTGIGVHVATLVTSIVCIFYTTIGGLRAVVWTDALQTVLMVGATLAVLVLGVQKVGGLDRVWELCLQGQRIQSPDHVDQLVPVFLLDVAGNVPGLTGLFVAGVFSAALSFVSGVTLLGLPTEMYRYGAQYSVCLVSFALMGVTVALVFVPVFRDLNVDSCYQYLELRFDRRVRQMASLLFILNQGGLRAVVWTDALQTVLMVGATLAVLVLGVQKVGGLDRVWELCSQGKRLNVFDVDPSPMRRHTFWTVLIGTYFMYVAQCGATQGFVQRYIAVKSMLAAKWTVFWFTTGLMAVVAMSCFLGLLVFAAYHDCDPIITEDTVMTRFSCYSGGVFSAALSSMSTGINSVCGVLVEDVLAGRLPSVLSRDAWLRVFAVLTGVLCVALVLVAAFVGAVTSLVVIGSLVLATQIAVIRRQIVYTPLPVSTEGCPESVVNSTMPSMAETEDVFPLLRISHMYYCLMGSVLTLLVALPVSLLMPDKDQVAVLPRAELLHPLARRLLPSVRAAREAVPLVHLSNDKNAVSSKI